MSELHDKAAECLRGDGQLIAELAGKLLRPEHDNFVERPWGGSWLRRFKRVTTAADPGAVPWGEAFEIAAFDDDREARQHPSLVRFDDGSELTLPALLESQGPILLGDAFVARHGTRFPMLPKTLDVKELLSVQGHPPGHTEVYIIIDAEPGASLRLGFNRDVDAEDMIASLTAGLERQAELLRLVEPRIEAADVQTFSAPWFADRNADAAAVAAWCDRRIDARAVRDAVVRIMTELKQVYWDVLDSMNAIAVEPGQVIYNATPKRLTDETGKPPSAEVHALGNPDGREILALEIRRPGPTFRAWDNVRFPKREVDVEAAIGALNLRATYPDEFLCERTPIDGRDGASVSVDSEYFRVEHLAPRGGRGIDVPAAGPHSLHCLAGRIAVFNDDGNAIGTLEQGQSALVPIGVGAYRVDAANDADVVRVTLPEL